MPDVLKTLQINTNVDRFNIYYLILEKKHINFYIYTINIQHTVWCHFILLKTVEAMWCWLCGSCTSRFTPESQHQRGTLHSLVCSHLHRYSPARRYKQWTGAGDTHLHPEGPLKVTDTLTHCHVSSLTGVPGFPTPPAPWGNRHPKTKT